MSSSTSRFPPPVMSRVDPDAQASSWFFTNTDAAQRHIAGRANGAFSVCTRPGDESALDIFYIFNGAEANLRVVSAPRGLHLVGMSQYFSTLSDLISNSEVDGSCLGVLLNPDAPEAAGQRPMPMRMPGRAASLDVDTRGGLDEEEHVGKAWYLEDMAKERALELIEYEPQGAFIVRDSSSEPGCYALSYTFGGRVQHKLIETTSSGLRFRSSEQYFPTLSRLVEYYMRSPSAELKCLLMPPRDPAVVQQTRQKKLAEAQRTSTQGRTSTMSGGSMGRPAWDCRSLTREKAMEKLNGAPQGTFVIRPSDKSFAALSMVAPSGLYHMHIESDHRGVFFRKCTEVFPDLFGLVEFYSTTRQSDLPVPLTLPR